MDNDIGKLVSQCLNNPLIQHYFMKKKDMSYDEKKLQENNFSRMIGYCILFKEVDGIDDYMRLTDRNKQIQFLKMRIANKIGVQDTEIEDKMGEIVKYAFNNFIENGYVFHAGNSIAIENNMRYGLGFSESTYEKKENLCILLLFIENMEMITLWGGEL